MNIADLKQTFSKVADVAKGIGADLITLPWRAVYSQPDQDPLQSAVKIAVIGGPVLREAGKVLFGSAEVGPTILQAALSVYFCAGVVGVFNKCVDGDNGVPQDQKFRFFPSLSKDTLARDFG